MIGSAIGIGALSVDDATGIGVADDVLIRPLSGSFTTGLQMTFGG